MRKPQVSQNIPLHKEKRPFICIAVNVILCFLPNAIGNMTKHHYDADRPQKRNTFKRKQWGAYPQIYPVLPAYLRSLKDNKAANQNICSS